MIKSGWIRNWLYGAGSPSKKTTFLVGQPLKNDKFHLQENFRWHGIAPTYIGLFQKEKKQQKAGRVERLRTYFFEPPASSISMVANFHKMTVQVSQAGKLNMLYLACTHLGIFQKQNKHSSCRHIKSGPIICVNSYYAVTEWFCLVAVFHSLRVQ